MHSERTSPKKVIDSSSFWAPAQIWAIWCWQGSHMAVWLTPEWGSAINSVHVPIEVGKFQFWWLWTQTDFRENSVEKMLPERILSEL